MAYYQPDSKFPVGTRVEVTRNMHRYAENLVGLVGTVDSPGAGSIGVVFDEIRNPRSAYGRFYIETAYLKVVGDNTNNTNNTNNKMEEKTMHKITNYLNVVKIQDINGGRAYSEKFANFDPNLQAGDLCVIMLCDRTCLAKVDSISESTGEELYNEVISKVDTTDYDARVEAREKAAELKSKMEARAKQLQDIALYQMLAKDDPDMAALLQEYQDIPKM